MRYLITGHPLTPLFDEGMRHRAVGEVYEADLDPDIERVLIGAGALQPLDAEHEPVEQPISRPAEPAEPEAALPATATDPTVAPRKDKRAPAAPPQEPDPA